MKKRMNRLTAVILAVSMTCMLPGTAVFAEDLIDESIAEEITDEGIAEGAAEEDAAKAPADAGAEGTEEEETAEDITAGGMAEI